MKRTNIKGFVSLKWQIFILLTFVMLFINSVFYYQHSSNLNDEFKQNRDVIYQRNLQAFQGLIIAATNRLGQIGHLIPLFSGIKPSINDDDISLLKARLEEYWPILSIETDIEFIAYYDKVDLIHVSSVSNQINTLPKELISELIQPSFADEKPVTIINCQAECILLNAVPVLSQKEMVGVIVVGKSLVELIINFNSMSSTNIGLLTSVTGGKESYIKDWDVYISALSNYVQFKNILQVISETHTLNDLLRPYSQVYYQDHIYELRLYPMADVADSTTNHIIFIDDITVPYRNNEQTKQEILLTGILTIVVAEIIVVLALWFPLSRLRRTALALPLLAQSEYAKALDTFKSNQRKHIFSDEIHQLDASAIKLSHQLQFLETNIKSHEIDLASKMEELRIERDFVNELLNTAQVIIITQNSKGKILLLNNYGQSLTGYSPPDLAKMRFCDLTGISGTRNESYVTDQFNSIIASKESIYKHESQLTCSNGDTIHVAWLHSHLNHKHSYEPAILSVGLDITARIQAEDHITWLANHDPLTQLYNRRKFQEEFERILQNAERYQHRGSLLFLDLDHFKYINDTLGHSIGDNLLTLVASELKQCIRSTDVIARFGGDEFVILMPSSDEQSTMAVAKKINEKLSHISMPELLGDNHKISISIGIAYYPKHGESVDEILANADMAMYHVKKRRRGSWHVYKIEDHAKEWLQNDIYWRQQIEHALQHDRFFLEFQPIMNLETNRIELHEALIRMLDNRDQIISPESFIPMAERSNLILDIDHYVLEKTIKLLHQNNQTGKSYQMTVNLSAPSLVDSDLLPLIKELLSEYPISPRQLIFEITETTALADFSAAYSLINSIKAMGCLFALDDFGAGFSSFHYLKKLPVDYIKIDGAFIQSLASNRDDQVLVKAMNDVARWFGKATIAEHVEDRVALEILKKYKVNYAQGFHIGRPAPKLVEQRVRSL
ncbi:diguanylate cyclase/phosphodiesterase (GGDEF & EAL domains) with PAS/PAC sensor(s) [hydrothermal vent metagenome]|uniref:Diguanylate cyclase/phosphodiesterase (GGDEF & EAL domains) with PAS/PAC sensor(S) n=1 Tax=hydrothermal vent metagenome TaxID=652676 RepID=A0A3B0ZUM9_9ZZZZ